MRLRIFMKKRGLWTEDYEKKVEREAEELVDRAVEEAERLSDPDPADIIRYTYAELTPRQIKELKESGWER